MTIVLDRDLGADAYSRMGGRLFKATLKHARPSATPPADPTNITIVYDTYVCDAIAFSYKQEQIDGDHVLKGDYRVVILRRSFTLANAPVDDVFPLPNDVLSIPPPGGTAAVDAQVIEIDVATEAQFTVHVRGVKAS